MAKMTKSQIVEALASAMDIPKKEANRFFAELSELAYKEVKRNGEFVLPGFGKMVKTKRAARQGRNPATGETIQIPAKVVVKFRLAKAAKDAVL